MNKAPVKGGVRRRRNTQATVDTHSADTSLVEYRALSATLQSNATSVAQYERFYVPGLPGGLANPTGTSIVSYYSTGKFTNKTSVRWEPSVSFTTTGRLFVAFTDNPEVISTISGSFTTPATFSAYVRGMGNVVSFPVWQETDIVIPTRLRRKMFDTNSSITATPDILDRSCQIYMCVCAEGVPASTTLGGFAFKDSVIVEGIHSIAT